MTALAKLTALVGYTDSGYLDAHFDLEAGPDDIARTVYGEIRGERDAETIAWLGKKAREYRSTGSKQHAVQADAVDLMASKLARGAVRPNNLLGVVTRPDVLREAAKVAVRAARGAGDSEAGQYAASIAAGIAKELRAMADAGGTDTSPSGEITQPDFFQPDRTYRKALTASTWLYRCEHVTTDPNDGRRVSLGWHRRKEDDDGWFPKMPLDQREWDSGKWAETTDAGEGR